MSARITISFTVPIGHRPGDYAQLHGNGGLGDIEWDTPVNNERQDLFPGGAGIFGYGHAPYGHFRYGHAHSTGTVGYGHNSYGHFPYGHGATELTFHADVTVCGSYKFGVKCFDAAGNAHDGTPDIETLDIHIAPSAPTGLKLNDYNKTTDILTLDAA